MIDSSCARARKAKALAMAVHTMVLLALAFNTTRASAQAADSHERIFTATFSSAKPYADPFNDVEVDVIFSGKAQSWRVPAFWSDGNTWTLRFAPPASGDYCAS